jgi:hypothetical protein
VWHHLGEKCRRWTVALSGIDIAATGAFVPAWTGWLAVATVLHNE